MLTSNAYEINPVKDVQDETRNSAKANNWRPVVKNSYLVPGVVVKTQTGVGKTSLTLRITEFSSDIVAGDRGDEGDFATGTRLL